MNRMTSRLSRTAGATLAAALLAASLALPLAAPASAATTSMSDPCATQRATFVADPTLANAKALGDCMGSIRLTFLSKATARVGGSTVLTAADRTALLGILSTDTSGISALKTKLDGETTVKPAVADFRAMVLDYRVFVLGGRQVALVIGADTVATIAARFEPVHQKLEALIDAAAARGRDVTAARASLAAMDASVAQARSDVAGVPGTVLPLTPSGYDAGSARPVLDAARASVRAGHDSLVAARKDAAAVLADLGR